MWANAYQHTASCANILSIFYDAAVVVKRADDHTGVYGMTEKTAGYHSHTKRRAAEL
jgi:hypothetical protein